MFIHSFRYKDVKSWRKNRGMFYSKSGCGIEVNPNSKRKPNDPFNLRKVKGSPMIYKGIYREKSKQEPNGK